MRPFPRMDKEVRNNIALALHMSAEAMLLAPDGTMATEISRRLAIMAAAIDYGTSVRIKDRTDAPSRAIVAALDVMTSVDARHDRTGKWGLTGDEATVLRSAVARFDEALLLIPWPVYQSAQTFVDEKLSRPTLGVKAKNGT